MYRTCSFSRCPVRPLHLVALLALVTATLAACGPTISKFNATAYEQATSLKVESLALMEEATQPYDEHASEVRALQRRLRKAHEFADGRPNNKISAQQWETLIDTTETGNLLGGFLKRWENDSSLNKEFVKEKKEQVEKAFDTIIQLESGKMKPEGVQGGT